MVPERESAERHRVEAFKDSLSNGLLGIDHQLSDVHSFTPEQLTHERIEAMRTTLQRLAREAGAVGELSKAKMLEAIEMAFYGLLTVGIADNPDKFEQEAYRASSMMEIAVLALDDISSKNKGSALRARQERVRE